MPPIGFQQSRDMDDSFYRHLMDSLYDGVYFVNVEKRITYWNKGAERLTGYTREEAVGKACQDNFLSHVDDSGNSLCECGCPLGQVLQDGKPREANLYLHHKNGHRVPVSVRVAPIVSGDGRTAGAVEIFSDNSSHVAARRRIEELEQLALLDPLTRIGNRRYLDMTLDSRLAETLRYDTRLTVFFLDVDDFKHINDTYGHATGDEVLKAVAGTLGGIIRPTDTLGRWGGDEFVVAVSNINRETARIIGERFRVLIEGSSVNIPGGRVSFTVSAGMTIARDRDDLASVIKRADRAMYEAKKEGKNRVKFG